MQSAAAIPGMLFIAGIVAIFISAGNMVYMIAGDAAIFLAGITSLKVLK